MGMGEWGKIGVGLGLEGIFQLPNVKLHEVKVEG